MSPFGRSRTSASAVVLGALVGVRVVLGGVPLPAQQPTFRSGVELIAVDVQVVDDEGNPNTDLAANLFEVSIGNRRRTVVSATLMSSTSSPAITTAPAFAPATARATEAGRQFILAIDQSSFEVGDMRAPMDAARAFTRQLRPEDRVGLYVYPAGPQLPPSTDRAQIGVTLSSLLGRRREFNGIFHLKPSEVVDITAQGPISNPSSLAGRTRVARDSTSVGPETDPLRLVQARECPDDPECVTRIMSEASAEALHLEAQASTSLGGLSSLLDSLATWPGRKTVVLVSAGILVSDRPGGRPDVGNMAAEMGRAAAAANAVVYTVHVDPSFTDTYAAGQRRIAAAERSRDRRMFGDWLDQFSAASGGVRLHVPVGAGEFAFERIGRETTAYYLLGVEPAADDRDGRAHELRVKVNRRGVTVRSRQWVVVPKA